MSSLTRRECAIHSVFPWLIAKTIIDYDRINNKSTSRHKTELSLHMFKNSKIPKYLQRYHFDCVIFHTIFLAVRWRPDRFINLMKIAKPLI